MRRATAPVTAALATAFTAALLTSCGTLDRAMDCANAAVVVAESADDLQQAVNGATENPTQAREALDRIDKNLKRIDTSTGDSDVGAAAGDLREAVDNARTSLDKGETPDVTPVGGAADKLTRVCTPG
ncbi:hypothetical protein QNO07_10155 [Streptomyces sp. 549]|uniref:hypothetical protein n=1 Tax=Streptomyces sp. 549 TaxID=3049076 RepID=UPI0024C29E41|nr:hypothetical protein [Streptomyces sp. 549]MDK1473777.1 hypothetical protein [Streptomyces sp. 549]